MNRGVSLLVGVAVLVTALVGVGGDGSPAAVADSPRFVDVPDGHVFGSAIEWLADQGITKGCDPPSNDRFCPDARVTRGQMAAFLTRLMFYRDGAGSDWFADDDVSIFQADIERLAEAGVTKGCNPPDNTMFCPNDPVTRGQMAAFLVRALGLTDDGGGNTFVDDDGSVFESDIAKLAAAGITAGCNPPANDRFCPNDYVTRGQMATFMWRAMGEPDIGSPGVNRFDPTVTTVVGENEVANVTVDAAGNDMVTMAAGAVSPPIDHILAMRPTSRYPNGVLGRVIDVAAVGGGGLLVSTEQVPLQAAMPEVHLVYQSDPVEDAVAYAVPASAKQYDLKCAQPGEALPDLKATIDVKGPSWNAVFNWGPGVPTVAHLTADVALDSALVGSTPIAGVDCDLEWEPVHIPLGSFPGPGGFPVDVALEFELEGQVRLDTRVGFNFSRHDFFHVGAEYANGGFHRISEHHDNADTPEVTISSGGTLNIYVGPQLDLSYRDRLGAEIKIGPYVDLTADVTDNPWWILKAGGRIAFDINWDLFIEKGEITVAEINCCERILAQASGPYEGSPVAITTTALPEATEGESYAYQLQAEGGTPPYTWTVRSGTLPDGLVLSSGGEITGTPVAVGVYNFEIAATDTNGLGDLTSLGMIVASGSPGWAGCASRASVPQQQCDALVAFYLATGGDNWTDNTGWLDIPDPCNWFGVSCTDGKLIRLVFTGNSLVGSIPSRIDDLADLEVLSLYNEPSLSGVIPPELGNLTNLYFLQLGDTALSGTIPPELGGLTDLTVLSLDGDLSGSIPPELGNLSNLYDLALAGNPELSGPVPPELGDLTNLTQLSLSFNSLTGSIPPELGNLSKLEWLSLDDNLLSGAIPPELGSLENLETLYLYDNSLSGPLPPELGNLSNLDVLWLANNSLSGSIPPELGNLTNLTGLSLSFNSLTGSIPPELGNLSNLTGMYLSDNSLSGLVPDALLALAIDRLELHGQTGCLIAESQTLANWLESFDSHWNDGCG